MSEQALLVLADGTSWRGISFGASGQTLGQLAICTDMTGYQERLTAPTSAGQILVMTAPHIGNTGVNDQDSLSGQPTAAGLVVRAPARRWSNWRGSQSLPDWLANHGVVAIGQVDTRAITLHLRQTGPVKAGIFTGSVLFDQRGRELPLDQLLELVVAKTA